MIVLDTSVLLANLLGEPGGECLELDNDYRLSIVNLAELHSKISERGGSVDDVRLFVSGWPIRIEPLGVDQAERIGSLRPLTARLGLSLGDRACLALAMALDVPAWTAERRWAEAGPALGLDVHVIR